MSPFLRRQRPVQAQVGAGFVAAEAPALQTSLRSVLSRAELAARRAQAQLRLQRGAQGRVVVSWRNRIVGFVPTDRRALLAEQLDLADVTELVVPGLAYRAGDLWRVWVGPPPVGDPPVPGPGYDELEPQATTVFGLTLSRPGRERRAAPAEDRWLLRIDDESWDVRDGVDIDVAALRSRLAQACQGDTVHLRVWQDTVPIRVRPGLVVTLTAPAGGAAQVLYPPEP